MIKSLIQPTFILIFFLLVRSADLAITNGIARNYIRCLFYSFVAILALIVVIIALLGS